MTQVRTSRRIVFHGLGALGVAVALAGCSGGDEPSATGSTSGDPTTPGTTTPTAADPTTTESTESAEPTEPVETSEPAVSGLVAAADVPVGGGIVLPDQSLVVVQPTEGEFKAYSSACTHEGTPVNQVDGTEMVCPNHGSRFSIDDGSAVQGPATAPLAEVAVALDGDQVVLA